MGIYLLCHQAQLTNSEIGQRMGGLPEGTVRKFLTRSSFVKRLSFKRVKE